MAGNGAPGDDEAASPTANVARKVVPGKGGAPPSDCPRPDPLSASDHALLAKAPPDLSELVLGRLRGLPFAERLEEGGILVHAATRQDVEAVAACYADVPAREFVAIVGANRDLAPAVYHSFLNVCWSYRNVSSATPERDLVIRWPPADMSIFQPMAFQSVHSVFSAIQRVQLPVGAPGSLAVVAALATGTYLGSINFGYFDGSAIQLDIFR